MVPSPHPYEERGTPTLGTLLPLAQAVKETQKHRLFPAPLCNHKMPEGICLLGLLWVLDLLFSHDYQGRQPPVSSSRACGLAVVGQVPPLGPKSKGLHLVGGPQSILQYQLMEGRGLWGELLHQVARSEGEPLAPQTWKEASTSQMEPPPSRKPDRPLNQHVPSQMKEWGSKGQGAYF